MANMENRETPNVYICKLGHRSNHPGICPQDRSRMDLANYICDYCDYASRVLSKSGRCPSCDAPMRAQKPKTKTAA